MGQLQLQVVIAFIVSKALEFAKHSNWRIFDWISPDNPNSTKFASGISAFLVGVGVTITHTGSFTGGGGMDITISHVSLSGIVNGGGAFLLQWLLQHGFWKTVWAKPLPLEKIVQP